MTQTSNHPGSEDNLSYDPKFFAPLFAAEDRHFWFRSRRNLITGLVRKVIRNMPTGYAALEVGCGTGNVLKKLEQVCGGARLTGMDLYLDGLRYAGERVMCSLVQGDMFSPPFGEAFHLIGLFDVLEHLPDDQVVLGTVRDMLTEGGWLIITVPAGPELWSYFDTAAHHVRRYQQRELSRKLIAAGLQVEYSSYCMMSLYPPTWFVRRVLRRKRAEESRGKMRDEQAVDELRIVPVVNEILSGILNLEAGLISQGVRLPFGTSLVALARRVS